MLNLFAYSHVSTLEWWAIAAWDDMICARVLTLQRLRLVAEIPRGSRCSRDGPGTRRWWNASLGGWIDGRWKSGAISRDWETRGRHLQRWEPVWVQ